MPLDRQKHGETQPKMQLYAAKSGKMKPRTRQVKI